MTYIYVIRLINYLRLNWIRIILIVLSIHDLRIDLRLLLDYFTFSTLLFTFSEHPLAITVLITTPTLLNHKNK